MKPSADQICGQKVQKPRKKLQVTNARQEAQTDSFLSNSKMKPIYQLVNQTIS